MVGGDSMVCLVCFVFVLFVHSGGRAHHCVYQYMHVDGFVPCCPSLGLV